jgi:translation initiation factor 2 alpha subunit (eIF-2alpha)
MLDFGAVVEYLEAPGNEVLLHVSELLHGNARKMFLM